MKSLAMDSITADQVCEDRLRSSCLFASAEVEQKAQPCHLMFRLRKLLCICFLSWPDMACLPRTPLAHFVDESICMKPEPIAFLVTDDYIYNFSHMGGR
jgi:hypothetical protein